MSNVTAASGRTEPDATPEHDADDTGDRDVTVMEPTRDKPSAHPKSAARNSKLTVFNIEDNLRQKSEIKILRAQLRQTQNEYRNEQEMVIQLKRRLNTAERSRIEESTKISQESVTLQTSSAKLRSQVEQTQADKQALEYTLAKIKRDVINERKQAAEREQRLSEQADALRDQVKQQDRLIKELSHHICTTKEIISSNQDKYELAMEEKTKEMDIQKSELQFTISERNRLETIVQEKESILDEINEKLTDFEDQLRRQAEIIRKQMTELAMTKDHEDSINAELEAAKEKLRLLEESVEAERAAHLESKFNSEIVQLKVKDLEGALHSEKTTACETSSNFDQLNKQYKDLLDQYHQVKNEAAVAHDHCNKLQKENEQVRLQLNTDLEEKKSVIFSLSDQIALHQSNFETLKDELQKAKRRQGNLEETYGASMRELELLLDNFNLDDEGKKVDSRANPSVVLENLRRTLLQYKKQLNITGEELAKMKKLSETFAKECESYKDMIWTKDKALEETQRSYTQASKDLNRLRGEFVECEAQQAQMKAQFQIVMQERDREVHNARATSEEIQILSKKLRSYEEEHVNYLHSLYQRVVIGRSISEPKTSALSSYKWQDLSVMVTEQISSLISNLHRTDDKISQLEASSRSKEEMIQQMQRDHDDQLDKLEKLSTDRELAWQKQKTELEQHYCKLLAEVHIRSKKSQSLADQAWERVRATGSVQQGLEGECLNLMNSLNQMKQEQQSITCACALLAGAFFSLYARYSNLVTQHKLLGEQADQASAIYAQARLLVDTLQAELNQSLSKFSPLLAKPALFRFRSGVIAVIAAGRLRHYQQSKVKMFTTYDLSAGLNGLPVWCGGVVRLVERSPVRDDCDGQNGALSWLTDDTLRQTVLSATVDLQDVLSHASKQGSLVDSKFLIGAAKTSFAKLTEQLSHFYPPIDKLTPHREKTSLARQLGNGLHKLIVEGDRATKDYFCPPPQVMNRLQQYVLDLAKRLHDSEIQKRHLCQQLFLLESESQHLKGEADHAQVLYSQLNSLKIQSVHMVEGSRFEQACGELNSALAREQQAQKLLAKQAKEIEDITVRLDSFMADDRESRKNLNDTIQNLSKTKLELRQKEHQLRQLNKNLTQLEADNADLLNNIRDAEQALRTTTRDRDNLCIYMKGVESVLEHMRRNLAVSNRLKPSQCMDDLMALMPASEQGKAGPESLACQRLVTAFVDVQQQLLSRLVSVESDAQLHKDHIQALKLELASACQRAGGGYAPEGGDFMNRDDSKPSRQTADGKNKNDFTSLQLNSDTPIPDCTTTPAHAQSGPKRSGVTRTRSLRPVKDSSRRH